MQCTETYITCFNNRLVSNNYYDFYYNSPNTICEIMDYLNLYFKVVPIEERYTIEYNNMEYICYLGFRRGNAIHNIYINLDTKKHIFHVSNDDDTINYINFIPNMGCYKSYDECILEVAKIYYKNWILHKPMSQIKIKYH
jgi:hypothetical protein